MDERAGVHVIWVSEAVDRDGRAALTVVIEPSTEVMRDLPQEALGVISDPGDGTRWSLAYVFGDRVKTFADSYHLSVAAVLGCALAHEIGHLLLPVNAHHGGGIMRASWQPDLFRLALPVFSGLSLNKRGCCGSACVADRTNRFAICGNGARDMRQGVRPPAARTSCDADGRYVFRDLITVPAIPPFLLSNRDVALTREH